LNLITWVDHYLWPMKISRFLMLALLIVKVFCAYLWMQRGTLNYLITHLIQKFMYIGHFTCVCVVEMLVEVINPLPLFGPRLMFTRIQI
jgi:hypothetical protein